MDPITLTPTAMRTNLLERKRILSDNEYSLISQINVMLELVIMNTLEFNKLTSTQEILDKLIYVHENTPDQDFGMDIDTIENICQLLCMNHGILIKLVKNDVNYYKLNHNM